MGVKKLGRKIVWNKKLDKKLGLTNQVKKIGWTYQEHTFSGTLCVKYGQKIAWKRWVEQLGEKF